MSTATERLKAIRERAEKATEGPWEKDYGGTRFHIKSIGEHPHGRTPTVARYDTAVITISKEEQERNGDFIAAARTDVPDLAKCLEAVMAQCNETVAEYLPGDGHWSEARQVLAIINRELGGQP